MKKNLLLQFVMGQNNILTGLKLKGKIMHLVKMEKGIMSGKRHNANRHNAKRHNANRHRYSMHSFALNGFYIFQFTRYTCT